jgi:hypothetical protein
MSLIKTISEFQKFVRLQGTISDDTIMVAVPDAQEKYIRQILGDELLADLELWYNLEDPTEMDHYTALLPYVQRALARFTIFVVSPELDVNVTSSGIGVVSSDHLAPASSDRVAKFDKNNELRGWDNVETLLRFLENNAADYPEWVASEGYTLSIRNLVNSATEFDRIFSIGKSRLMFNNYRPVMDDVDMLRIYPVISEDLFTRIITEIKAKNITSAVKAILPLLQRAEVYFAAVDKIDRSNYNGVGVEMNLTMLNRDIELYTSKAKTYLSQALAIMNANIADYPEYRDSGIYNASDSEYENKQENPIYVFGG